MASKTPTKGRNREATRTQLIAALESVMLRDGFRGLGINAIAKQAAVDKVLIYRYFAGLDGLLYAYAQEADLWPSNHELCGGDVVAFYQLPLVERRVTLMRNLLQAIRRRPVTQEVLAWELIEPNVLGEALERLREQRELELQPLLLDRHQNRENPYTHILSAIIGATISYLAPRARHSRRFDGLDLHSEQGWGELAASFERLIRLDAGAD